MSSSVNKVQLVKVIKKCKPEDEAGGSRYVKVKVQPDSPQVKGNKKLLGNYYNRLQEASKVDVFVKTMKDIRAILEQSNEHLETYQDHGMDLGIIGLAISGMDKMKCEQEVQRQAMLLFSTLLKNNLNAQKIICGHNGIQAIVKTMCLEVRHILQDPSCRTFYSCRSLSRSRVCYDCNPLFKKSLKCRRLLSKPKVMTAAEHFFSEFASSLEPYFTIMKSWRKIFAMNILRLSLP